MLEFTAVALIALIVGYRLARFQNFLAMRKCQRRLNAERHDLHTEAFNAGANYALHDWKSVHTAYMNMTNVPKNLKI